MAMTPTSKKLASCEEAKAWTPAAEEVFEDAEWKLTFGMFKAFPKLFWAELSRCSRSSRLMLCLWAMCLVAFFLPLLEEPGHGAAAEEDSEGASTFGADALAALCDQVPPNLEDRYAHPVTGIAVAVAAVLLLYVYKTIIKYFDLDALQDSMWEWIGMGHVDDAPEAIDAQEGAQRSFFLILQVLLFAYLSGQYLFAGPVLQGDLLCRFVGPWVLAPVYKPAVPTFWYLTMRVLGRGSMHNNVWTLTLNVTFVGAVVLWLLVALVFTVPLTFGCFGYFGLAFMSPALVHLFVWPRCFDTQFRFKMTDDEFNKKQEDDRTEIMLNTMIVTRLFLGGLVVSIAIGASLLPFYQGASYVHVLSHAVAEAMEGLKIWTPDFALTFAWPATLRFPEKFGLAAALTMMGSEYALLAFQAVYNSMFPRGVGPVKERTVANASSEVAE